MQTYVQVFEGVSMTPLQELTRAAGVFLYSLQRHRKFAVKIKRIVPQAKVIIAHGQMRKRRLKGR